MTNPRSGGCQCGAVRFQATGFGIAAICHCRMCQKAFGHYFAPLVRVDNVEWTRGTPTYFRSSNKAQRGFCPKCGTPLCYRDDDGGIELAAGALDDPDSVPPTVQFNLKNKLALFDSLAKITPQPHPEKEANINAEIICYQHPDHETQSWPLGENS